jgi:subtilisin family serine protease
LVILSIAVACLSSRPVEASPGNLDTKLDARARIAYGRLRSGREPLTALLADRVAVTRGGEMDVFITGTASRSALEAAGARVRYAGPGVFTAFLPVTAVDRVAALDGVTAIRAAVPLEPELDVSLPAIGATPLRGTGPQFAGLNGQGVLIGIVDTGIDFDHGDFLDGAGHTRLVSLWDQTVTGSGVPGFTYGREWTPAEIDGGACTETDDVGHGTHVMGIAAGDGSQVTTAAPYSFAGVAPRADLIVVKSMLTTSSIVDAVQYIFQKASERGESAVVNLSIGTQEGPHDGTSDIEHALSTLTGPGRIIVKSGGNDRGTGKHGEVFATAGGASVTLSVTGSFATRNFGVDGFYDATERMRVRVQAPGGTVIGPLAIGGENAPYPGQSTVSGTVFLAQDSLDTGRIHVYLEVNVGAGQSMNGTWTITFLADQIGSANGQVDLWRFLAAPGVTANFVAGNQPTRELVTEPGNAPGVITVGAYVTRQSWIACNGVSNSFGGVPAAGNLATFSSPGPTRDGRLKPELAAPGDAIISTSSFDLLQSCPAPPTPSAVVDGINRIVMRGTSMAAPHVAGAAALLLQKYGALTPAQIVDYLRVHTLVDGMTGAVPNPDWGYGKVRLGDLVDPVVQLVTPTGGESLPVGSPRTLQWNATDALGGVTGVDLMLSRSGPTGPWESIATGVPNTGSAPWTVTGPTTGGATAYLWVRAVDANGNAGNDTSAAFTIQGPLSVGDGAPVRFALGRVQPNPTRGRTLIEYSVAHETHVRLVVQDVQGRVVATLVDRVRLAGRFVAEWDGRDRSIAPGLYFVRYDSPGGREVRRIALTP